MNEAIIAIGSNENAEKNIVTAFCMLNNLFDVISISSVSKTKAYGRANQPDYTNCAIKINTVLAQKQLKTKLKKVEDKLGRDRTPKKNKLCTIDLDIATWNGSIVDTDYFTRDYLKKMVDEIFS